LQGNAPDAPESASSGFSEYFAERGQHLNVSEPTSTEKTMNGSELARAAVVRSEAAPADSGGPRRLRIRFEEGTWRLSEDGPDRIGGRFVSLSSAVDFARAELSGAARSYVVLELGVAGHDERSIRQGETRAATNVEATRSGAS
jgi:hypothetical protein